MEKPILVALDESERALGVLDSAVALARKFHTELVLFRSIPLPAVALAPDGMPVGIDMQAELERRSEVDLDALAHRVPNDVPARRLTLIDVPWRGICEAAKREDAALVVIGSHAYGGIERLLGTTAAQVVNHADRSVLVVRSHWPN
jgi:nucleotide-binding universal stress UspA family protein